MRVISLNLFPYLEADEAARESMSPFTSELLMTMIKWSTVCIFGLESCQDSRDSRPYKDADDLYQIIILTIQIFHAF